jgi:flagellar hook-length control protein FliK
VKPLLGQLQNAGGLDELMSSSRPVGGNFDRAGLKQKGSLDHKSGDTSFSDMLLSTIHKAQTPRQSQKPEIQSPKIQSTPTHQSSLAAKQAFAQKVANSETRLASSQGQDLSKVSAPMRLQRPSNASQTSPARVGQFDDSRSNEKPMTTESTDNAPTIYPTIDASQKQATMTSAPATQVSASAGQNVVTVPNQMNGMPLTAEQISALSDATGAMPQIPADQLITPAGPLTAESKAALSPLKNLMAGKPASDALINRNPVLAFVTGHLEKLDPETLPALVTDSALIKQAISANEVAQFMQTPMTIGDLTALLELDQTLINKASQAGLDPSKLVTPKEFFQALGLDAGRIASELSILKQKLPSEGISSYVQRAKALAANADKNLLQSTVASAANKLNKETISDLTSGQKSAGDVKDRVSSEVSNTAGPEPIPQVIDQSVAANAKNELTMNAAGLAQFAQKNVSGLSKKPAAVSQQPSTQISNMTLNTELATNRKMMDPGDLLAAQEIYSGQKLTALAGQSETKDKLLDASSSGELDGALLTTDTPNLDLISFTELSGQDIAKDPYLELGRLMESTSATKVDFGGDGINQRSLEEHLISSGLNVALQQNSEVASGKTKAFEMPSSEEPRDFFAGEPFQDLQANLFQETPAGIKTSSESSFANLDFSQGESFQDEASSFLEQNTDVTINSGKQTVDNFKSGEVFADKVSETPKAPAKDSIASKIMGQAQMMFKNGGGSMRLDVEAPGIGKVDVAINLINNQLDVRIITASEQARDMISKEVSGLRDGLIQQGISLRGLEVGKAGESSPRNFAGQGQQFGQGAPDQRASYSDMREYAQSFKNSFAPRADRDRAQVAPSLSRWSNASVPSKGNGRLEVRV